MVELTRRWFVIGSAAAIAVAAVPFSTPVPAQVNYTPVPAQVNYVWRKVCRLNSAFDLSSVMDGHFDAARIQLLRGNDCLLDYSLNVRAFFDWQAPPGGAIIIPQKQTLNLSLEAPCGIGHVQLFCLDKLDDETTIAVVERHTFPKQGPAEAIPINLDDAERLERWRVRSFG